MIRGCNFQENKNQVKLESTAFRAIITDNFVRGEPRIDSQCQNARIEGNIGSPTR